MKLLWYFNIRTDCVTEARPPDIVIIDKNNQETLIINVAIPEDFCVRDKKAEKILEYQDLALEIF